VCNVLALFNNTILTICNEKGEVITWKSSGTVGYKGAKKSTPYVAGLAGEAVAKAAISKGVKSVDVISKGPGMAKLQAIKSLSANGLIIKSIKDITPIPHNGCRPRKRRKV